jgi:hypothetical protein
MAARPARGRDERPRLISNIVLMGMGEPLYNFENVRDAMKIAMDRRRHRDVAPADHAVDLRRGARDRALRRGNRLHAGGSRSTPRPMRCATGWCRSTSGGTSPLLDALRAYPKAVEFRAHHLRIRDAEGHQRQRRGCAAVGETDRGHPGEDQPDPVQRMARRALSNARTGRGSSALPISSTRPAMPRPSERRGGRTSWPPAVS